MGGALKEGYLQANVPRVGSRGRKANGFAVELKDEPRGELHFRRHLGEERCRVVRVSGADFGT